MIDPKYKIYLKQINLDQFYHRHKISKVSIGSQEPNSLLDFLKITAPDLFQLNNIVFCNGLLIFLGATVLHSTQSWQTNSDHKYFYFHDHITTLFNLIYVHTDLYRNQELTYWIHLIIGRNSNLHFQETYVGHNSCFKINIEIHVRQNALVHFYMLSQKKSATFADAIINHDVSVKLTKNTTFQLYLGTVQALLHNYIALIDIVGENAYFDFRNVCYISEKNLCYRFITINHYMADTKSNLTIDVIAHGHAQYLIYAYSRSIKELYCVELRQHMKGFLLSNTGIISFKPALLTGAGDVKAVHGASITHLCKKVLFFLQTRSLSTGTSESLMMTSFLEKNVFADIKDHESSLVKSLGT